MKTTLFLIFSLLAASLCCAQDEQPAAYGEGWFMLTNSTDITVSDGTQAYANMAAFQVPQGGTALAESVTPDIANLAQGLKNDPKRIFDFVHDHIRYVHYFGSHKGAELTLLERSGNDFDQCALLMALLTSAGLSANYQFGTVSFPYTAANQQDYQHWVTTTMPNTNWNTTMAFMSNINAQGCFPFTTYLNGDTNDVVFHHVWISLSWNGTNYTLDPSFKVSQPVAGISLDSAMGLTASDIMSSAAGTHTADYVQGLNEAALRSTLQGYNSNLLNYLQTNCPNASVEQIIGGQRIVSSVPYALGQVPLAFTVRTDNGNWPTSQWQYIPTNLMAVLTVTMGDFTFEGMTFVNLTQVFYTPALNGSRLSLTFTSFGEAELYQEDTMVNWWLPPNSGGQVNVTLAIQHPFGTWNFTGTNNLVRSSLIADQSLTKGYQYINANYILLYGFDPAPAWLTQRQQQLDAYLKEGCASDSPQVTTEALNVMGLNWLVQTELDDRIVAAQEGVLTHRVHILGRMAQEAGRGYYVDVFGRMGSLASAVGADAAAVQAANQVFQVNTYLDSALEHGMIEQQQASNLTAASTVKILELASTNSQKIYLASANNWTAGAGVSSHLVNYDLSGLYDNYINHGFALLLPTNGSVSVAGSGSWTGTGFVALQSQGNSISCLSMYIGGGYNGGYVSDPTAAPDSPAIVQIDQGESTYFTPQSAMAALPAPIAADPVNMADGTFQISSTDLALGQTEPRGLSLTRYYSSSRRNSDSAGMANGWLHNYNCNVANIAAPLPGLGLATPRQMAPMLVAIRSALNVYNGSQPDPKNWVVTALIAKWGIDQVVKNGVSVNLGNNTIEFIRQPDGSYTPPANCTMTLTGISGAYALQERHGRTFKFNNKNLLTNIVDQYGNANTFTYNSSNWVSTASDWKGRTLTFTYSGTPSHLTSVSDGARTVSYGYTANAQGQLDLTSVTDPEGKTSAYTYDTNHQIITTVNPNSQVVVSNVYDAYGRVLTQYTGGNTSQTWQVYWSPWQASADDPIGGEQNFYFDDQSRQVGCQDALGNLTQTFYDGQDHVIRTISPLNETNLFFYDGSNDLVCKVDAMGFTNTSLFDSRNNLVETIDPLGHARCFGYNAQFSLTGQTNGAGDWMTCAYNSDGTLASRTDSAGTTSYGYDTFGTLNSITYPDGLGGESFANNAFGDPTNHTDGQGFTTTFAYNNRRQLTNTIAPTNLTATATYDANANLSTTTDPRGFTTSNNWSVTRHLLGTTFPPTPQGTPVIANTYDPRDWLASTQNPLGKSTYYTNDAAQRLIAATDPLQRTTLLSYDSDSRPTNTTDAASEQTVQFHDARGSVTRIIDAATNIVGRAYDAAGNLIHLTNRNGNLWQFQYDAANRLTNTISPLLHSASQTYNDRGLLQSTTDPLNQTTALNYDARGRLFSKIDNIGVNYYGFDANNNLTSLSTDTGDTRSWAYDAYNRLTAYTDDAGNFINYQYDASGNLTNLFCCDAQRNGLIVSYYYDSNNRLTNVTDCLGQQTTFTYDLAGHLTTLTRPNHTIRSMSYDDDGELTNIIEQAASKYPICFYTLHYNPAGRSDWEFKGPLPHTNTPPARTMTHDADNRLATFNGTSVTVDNDGNLTRGPLTNNTFATYAYDARNELTSAGGISYAYDPAGNRTSLTSGTTNTTFFLDPRTSQPLIRVSQQGQVAATNTVLGETLYTSFASLSVAGPAPAGFTSGSSFALSGFTNPLAALNGNWTSFVLECPQCNPYTVLFSTPYGSEPSGNYHQQGSLITSGPSQVQTTFYVTAPGIGLLYEINSTGAISFYHYDSRGSTVALTDTNGNPTDQIEYSPYGTTTYRTGTTDTPFLYNGQFGVQTDPNGLLYMRARYYNPYISRFINSDPSGFGGGLNFYAFADGNPINELDPFGLGAVGENAGAPSFLDQFKQDWGLPTGVAAQQQGEQAEANLLNAVTLGLANPVAALATGQDLSGNNMEQGQAVQQLMQVAAVDSALLLTLSAGAWASDAQLAAGSFTQYGSAAEGTTTLYRAVGPAELADIQTTGVLRNLGSAEGKYFTTSSEAASSYAQQAVRGFGDPPYTTIQTTVPNSIFNGLTPATVDRGIPAWVIPNNRLPGLTPQVLNSMAIPH